MNCGNTAREAAPECPTLRAKHCVLEKINFIGRPTEYYLTLQFKYAMGLSVIDSIKFAGNECAEVLLKSTDRKKCTDVNSLTTV